MKKIYPNLNSLRFIAASLVIIHHIELYKYLFGLRNLWDIPFFQIIGKLGVVLFFVLSGFLITSLLLHEIDLKGKISIKNFYLRRVLRIWPLYYLIIILGFFVYPYIPFFDIPNKDIFPNVLENRFPNIFFYLTIFANLAIPIYKDVPYTSQTWSIATEEQFYLLWPFLFIFFRKKLLPAMLIIILGYWFLKYVINETHYPSKFINLHSKSIISGFLYFFNINCMAIGGIFAVIVSKKFKLLKLIFNNTIFILTSASTIALLIFGIHFGFFHYDIYAVLFAIIIVNLACNEKFKNLLENKITNYLGSISYGIYMYHFIALTIAIRAAIYFDSLWIIYPITFLLTFTISHFSYKYFENFFLKLKSKFN
ncbi:Peptidoglycan/LPS O-acetylase OafA/YrhL, contains acyltransferase and SGNH-hydrolase domains [Chryseobacterium sp. RU37D]|uniref:acyltransferase family protein n=1 Tax=Chryseobacterium sp. RU37D TaxID=1907397 RepID=UPI0009540579|nr:acyltransferase [Chryseobacterium sp. RU37D]SIQ02287.1 Peptidoglycan/LPS O-acetylase OafA/YrhL, contains acyltransferase and SGNH-hydrolase domains [Chryseobacterium sp. RU37D]